jgi:sarcosine oxidase delta subunit
LVGASKQTWTAIKFVPMGMFDSVMLKIKCPYCGQESEIECHTKELDCSLDVWRKGDFVGTEKLNHLQTIANCHSKECSDYEEKRIGYRSGFGRVFNVKVKLRNGIVSGDYEIE